MSLSCLFRAFMQHGKPARGTHPLLKMRKLLLCEVLPVFLQHPNANFAGTSVPRLGTEKNPTPGLFTSGFLGGKLVPSLLIADRNTLERGDERTLVVPGLPHDHHAGHSRSLLDVRLERSGLIRAPRPFGEIGACRCYASGRN